MTEKTDIIDSLLGIRPGSKAEALRARRPTTKEHTQKSYEALFSPEDSSQASLAERFAVALFVAILNDQADIADFYAGRLTEADARPQLLAAVESVAKSSKVAGPYGHYPAGPLSSENLDGPTLVIAEPERGVLGSRLAAALEHAHLLTLHPRDAAPAHLNKLLTAGWSATGVVTLSQLVSFLAFQIRIVAGIKVLAA
ncbi:CMD domain protein [Rhizobium sp. 2MFCol3.1]|uniref:CMD domain protein n=1 Tax=Rhizobium sp. 2MFCol3.1 TaxID=1246459 RepID=UPI00037D7DC3|nr:CMD domain protein [Rhizobium sp. 2MFCol3.1]